MLHIALLIYVIGFAAWFAAMVVTTGYCADDISTPWEAAVWIGVMGLALGIIWPMAALFLVGRILKRLV